MTDKTEIGYHEDGVGYAPDGTWCGECGCNTCVGCSVWASLKQKAKEYAVPEVHEV